MKKFWLIIGLCMFVDVFYLIGSQQPEKLSATPEKEIAEIVARQIDDFTALVHDRFQTAVEHGAGQHQLQQLFLETRLSYKKFEWAAEYFNPAVTQTINGPPVREIEMGGLQALDPEGLQVIEGLLFPKYDPASQKELALRLQQLILNAERCKVHFTHIDLLSGQIFDAAKLEVFRILTLGITGFDDPLSQNSMNEAANSLQSLKTIFAYYTGANVKLLQEFQLAGDYLRKNTGFNTFNRAEFILAYGNKMSIRISELEKELDIPVIKYNRLLRQDAQTLFDKNAFNVNAYAPGSDYLVTKGKVALGEKLFADPVLSGNGARSCKSCHQPEKAFTDGLVRNTEIDSHALLSRNTPTLLNAALQPSQFYDLRVNTLEDQVHEVVQNKKEMHGDLGVSVKRLWEDKTYRQLFSSVFPKAGRSAIDTLEVMNAISSYVRSLTVLNSRFDEYMRGDTAALNEKEVKGFNLFMGKAKCATCHYMPLFNGTVPPRFIKIETEVIGVPDSKKYKAIDKDPGEAGVISLAAAHAFKTTTVRNTARTAPYMHNGVFANLSELIDFYNNGGGAGAGLKVDNQTLSADHLQLSRKEKNELIAFIKSLDSK